MNDSILPPSEGTPVIGNDATPVRGSTQKLSPTGVKLAAFWLSIDNASLFQELWSVEGAANDLSRQRTVIRAITKLPLDTERARIVEDLCAIKTIPLASTVPGTLCRPDSGRLFQIRVVEKDWETVADILNESGFTQVGNGSRSVRFLVESARITIRKAQQESIITVTSDREPENAIKNFAERCRCLRKIIDVVQQHCTRDIHHDAVSAPSLPSKPSNNKEWIEIFQYFQDFRPGATNADIAREYGFSEQHIKNQRNILHFPKRSTKKY